MELDAVNCRYWWKFCGRLRLGSGADGSVCGSLICGSLCWDLFRCGKSLQLWKISTVLSWKKVGKELSNINKIRGDSDQLRVKTKLSLISKSFCQAFFKKRGDSDQLRVKTKLSLIFKSFCQAFFQKAGVDYYALSGVGRGCFWGRSCHLKKCGFFCEKPIVGRSFFALGCSSARCIVVCQWYIAHFLKELAVYSLIAVGGVYNLMDSYKEIFI